MVEVTLGVRIPAKIYQLFICCTIVYRAVVTKYNAITLTFIVFIEGCIHPHCTIPFEVTFIVDDETVKLIALQGRIAVTAICMELAIECESKLWWTTFKKSDINEHRYFEEIYWSTSSIGRVLFISHVLYIVV